MAYYDEQSFSQMQLDALARMRQMQQRSKSLVQESPPLPDSPPEPIKETHISPQTNRQINHTHNQPKPQNNASILTSLFSGTSGIDPEKLLIILMLYILYKNKADIKLLIALGYLLM